ncbi:type II secretion system F family protein [Ruficoccus sp. ZRK36]|uniref:type II secretion system F family protein n=1 Tax=Ruficoccus sp. ZRK36 TaxID=2866311 RepID=UPI001C738101|nr:type II secretion system F family protein [Ruficoccus sp. ZRK36]QYY36121.1 type II secretion system F family protein [Ruficoccus sp. ZRK36]
MTLSHKKLSTWYLQLAQLMEAGIGLPTALESTSGPPAHDRQRMAAALHTGQDIEQMLSKAPDWLPTADRQFLGAAALTGRFPQTLAGLAERHRRIASTQQKCLLACAYPLGILHLGVLAHAILSQINKQGGFVFNLPHFLINLLLPLGILWALFFLAAFLVKTGSPIITFLMGLLPGLRGYSRSQRIADLSFALKSFVEAGLPIGESWARAGAITGDARLNRAAQNICEAIRRSEQPSRHLASSGCFPADFISLYTSGEQSGQLDTTLGAIGRRYQDKANMGLNVAMILYPTLLFAIVAVLVVIQIFSFYAGYFSRYDEIMSA